jgi:hypothetical protein
MAAPYWKGGAVAVAQVWKGTITTTTNGHTYTVTLTDMDGSTVAITYTVVNPPDTTVTLVATGFINAWNASTDTRIAGITATQSAGQVILTADSAGVPFSVATSGSGTWTGTGNTTASAGPNDWGIAPNWSTGAVPVSTDDVTIDGRGSASSILYGLNQSGVTLASLNIYAGAPQIGDANYALRISATAANTFPSADSLNQQPGNFQGSGFWSINTGTNAVTWNVSVTSTTGISGLPALVLAGNHASNVLNVYGGTVGVGVLTPGQAGNFPTINVEGGTLITGSGTDFTTATNAGGTMTLGKGSTSGTVNSTAGNTSVNGATKVGTVNCDGGTVRFNARLSGDDIGTLVMNGGTLDGTGNAAVFSATNRTLKRGGVLKLASSAQFTITTPAGNTEDYSQGSDFKIQIGK